MNNVVHLRDVVLDRSSLTDEPVVSRKMFRTALKRMLSHSRSEGLDNTALTLELALTALDVDYEGRRA
jgi:hypothetical protein